MHQDEKGINESVGKKSITKRLCDQNFWFYVYPLLARIKDCIYNIFVHFFCCFMHLKSSCQATCWFVTNFNPPQMYVFCQIAGNIKTKKSVFTMWFDQVQVSVGRHKIGKANNFERKLLAVYLYLEFIHSSFVLCTTTIVFFTCSIHS